MAERGWDIPTAGAGLCERWAALAPDLADHVAAVGYDAERGELTLRPESTAWATKARLEQAHVIEAANSAAGHTVVRTLRILPPGAVPALEPDDVTLASRAVATGPAKTRGESEGYRRAIAAHSEAAPPGQADSAIAEAVERQTRVMRELSRRAFPDPESNPDGGLATIEDARARRRRQAVATEAAALRRARAEKASLTLPAQAPRRALEQAG
ncbi:DciA family protein [Streptomyces sp. NPDC059985]|uniref:DciA family protein n=1 Tax=Streptomyces sp. NPDC059985 TaxID=3347025 RepID=UPI003699B9FE